MNRFVSPAPLLGTFFPCLLLCFSSSTLSQESGEDAPAFAAEVDSGWLFVNGKYLEAPYRIEAGAEGFRVNAQEVPIGTDYLGPAPGFRSRPGWGPGFKRPRSGAWGENLTGVGNRWQPVAPSIRAARTLAMALENDAIAVVFENEPYRLLHTVSEQFAFFDAMLASPPSRSQIAEFTALAHTVSGEPRWEALLADYKPTPDLKHSMQSFVNDVMKLERRNLAEVGATRRLDQFAYPLTIAAMVLGVFAFGHLLQWVARGYADQSQENTEVSKRVTTALVLMIGMSVIDLTWTMLAVQAGVMSEVNPLASSLVSSPSQLALFKLIATGSALGILYFWRHLRKVQQATWWMCLVCVLLTFRWVVFDSMLQ